MGRPFPLARVWMAGAGRKSGEVWVRLEGVAPERVVYLSPADKYHRLTRRLSKGQKVLEERALMASQRPFHPW
jgi:hypothetical protein